MPTLSGTHDPITRALIIDDENVLCMELEAMLAMLGIEAVSLPSSHGVSEIIARFDPQIIFLDIRLQRSDAFDVMRNHLVDTFTGIVTLLSGSPLDFILDATAAGSTMGLRMGAALRKPIHQDDLEEAIYSAALLLASRSIGAETDPEKPSSERMSRLTLRQGLARNALEIWYQPTFHLATEAIAGAEALVRGRLSNGGIVPPAELFQNATRQDYLDLTDLVLRTVIGHVREMHEAGIAFRPSINVTGSFLVESDSARLVRAVADEPWWSGMVMEVTEDEALDRLEEVRHVALQLKLYAVDLSIDDFGAGYSSLARLRDLPFTELKLDRSFVHGCASDSIKLAICRNVLALGADLGCVTVAEGVEDEADLTILREIGCEKVQGFRLAKPMPFGELQTFFGAYTPRI